MRVKKPNEKLLQLRIRILLQQLALLHVEVATSFIPYLYSKALKVNFHGLQRNQIVISLDSPFCCTGRAQQGPVVNPLSQHQTISQSTI